MKKVFFLILMVLLFVQCNDDFLEKSSLTSIAENNFWKSESDAYLALNGVYSTLQTKALYGGNLNGGQGIPCYDGLSDNAYNAWEWEGPGQHMEGTMDAAHWWYEGIWNSSYQGISRVNAIIENVNAISDDLIDLESKNKILGQAYFLRALFNFNLALYFEDAPLILTTQSVAESYVPKNTYAEINNQIVTDLKFAVTHLPNSYANELFGYATKGAAYGLFARVQLYNHEYSGEFGVINLTEKAMGLGYSLHNDYAELFSLDGENSSEIVFAIRFLRGDDTGNGEMFSATYLASPKVDQQPMPNLVNDYYCLDGLPISESPLYDATNKKLNRDPRAIANFFFKNDIYNKDIPKIFSENLETKYGQRKYIRLGDDTFGNSPWTEGSQDFYLIRYADILLMRAEAFAETGNLSEARELVNTIRVRVNMPTVDEVEGVGLNQQQMIDLVRHERRVELALEGLRFMDLKRWGEMEEAINRASSDLIGPYSPQFLGGKTLSFPIPQSEIDVNPNLTQNSAWK